jgi:hypothetical protein
LIRTYQSFRRIERYQSAAKYNSVQYSTIQYSAVQYSTVQSAVLHTSVHCSTVHSSPLATRFLFHASLIERSSTSTDSCSLLRIAVRAEESITNQIRIDKNIFRTNDLCAKHGQGMETSFDMAEIFLMSGINTRILFRHQN